MKNKKRTDSSPTRTRRYFWIPWILESENWATPAQIFLHNYSGFCLIHFENFITMSNIEPRSPCPERTRNLKKRSAKGIFMVDVRGEKANKTQTKQKEVVLPHLGQICQAKVSLAQAQLTSKECARPYEWWNVLASCYSTTISLADVRTSYITLFRQFRPSQQRTYHVMYTELTHPHSLHIPLGRRGKSSFISTRPFGWWIVFPLFFSTDGTLLASR